MTCIVCKQRIPPGLLQTPGVPGPVCDKLACLHAALDLAIDDGKGE